METSDIAIRVENLGKRYFIGHNVIKPGQETFREAIVRQTRNFGRSASAMMAGRQILQGDEIEEFWALRNVSFEIRRGEVVGIIGRNGAGKSTLLKTLSRITEPTEGRISIDGRVASLLEVGTGFHPELTGRENVHLNGAILGMTKSEIRAKFDDIVEFSGVGRFLDTPVKRYSSGMYVRLAFAVAAHLDPEILIVDEVLSVGDAEFQKRCLGKMGEVASQGRTVLFVSHNMASLENICDRGILLANSTIQTSGKISEVISEYLTSSVGGHSQFPPPADPEDFHVISIAPINEAGREVTEVFTWDKVKFRISFYSPIDMENGAVTFQLSTSNGQLLVLSVTCPDHGILIDFHKGVQTIDVEFEALPVTAGEYLLGAGLAVANTKWLYNEPFGQPLTVLPRDIYHSGFAPVATRYPIAVPHRWDRNTIAG